MIRNILFIILVGVVLVFVFQNMATIEVKFLVWTLTVSRALILLVTLAVGIVGGSLLTYPARRQKARFKK